MIQRKRAGMSVPERIAAPAPNVVSLMDALKRSLATEEAKATEEPAAKAKKPKKRAAGQREMLLPIAGKETGKEKRKSPPGGFPALGSACRLADRDFQQENERKPAR